MKKKEVYAQRIRLKLSLGIKVPACSTWHNSIGPTTLALIDSSTLNGTHNLLAMNQMRFIYLEFEAVFTKLASFRYKSDHSATFLCDGATPASF